MPKIRIIDDDLELAGNIAAELEGRGYTVSTLDEIEGALKSLKKDMPDLLVLDVMFPENLSAGFDLARKIRQDREIRNLPIILLTGVNMDSSVKFSGEDIDDDWMPVQEFVDKPVDIEILVKKIEKLLAASK